MPLYEYVCKACGHRFEKIQNFSAEPLTECPKCKGELVRPLTAPALQFKGAGWYINDYSAKGAQSKTAVSAAAETAPCASCPASGGCDAAASPATGSATGAK